MKVDLHCHTRWSSDCSTRVEDVLQRYRECGIDCVAITDHNQIGGALEAQALGILRVIVGEEIRSSQGELIGLFLSERIPKGLSMGETVDAIKAQGGIVMAPHPTDRLRGSALRPAALAGVAGMLDMVEIFNGRTVLRGDNAAARRFQEARGLVACAGSDAHTLMEIGGCYNEIEDFDGPQEFLARMAQARLRCERSPLRVHWHSTVAKLRSRLERRARGRGELWGA